MKSLGKKVRCFIIRSDGQKNRNPVSKLECFKEIKKFRLSVSPDYSLAIGVC